jgi:Protein of unknown function, DUF606.
MQTFWIVLATLAGGCIAVQAAANSSLRSALNDARYAALFSIIGTVLSAAAFMLLLRPPLPTRRRFGALPVNLGRRTARGTLCAFWCGAVPRLGAAAFIAASLRASCLFAAADHFD